MENAFNFWPLALAMIVSGLFFAGYYHPTRYQAFIFLPLSLASFLLTLFGIGYGFGAWNSMVTLAPYLDPTKKDEILQIVGPNLYPFSDSTMLGISIVCVSALAASLLLTIGIVAANRGEDASHNKPIEEDESQEKPKPPKLDD